MSTFNGNNENLKFTCGSCQGSCIEIDLSNSKHKDKLWSWLDTHSENGGRYENVKIKPEIIEALKKEVKERTEIDHQVLVQYYGGVREYLLTMGEFKDVEI